MVPPLGADNMTAPRFKVNRSDHHIVAMKPTQDIEYPSWTAAGTILHLASMHSVLKEPDVSRLTTKKNSRSSLTRDLAPPTFEALSTEHTKIIARAKIIEGNTLKRHSVSSNLVIQACKTALRTAYVTMETEASLLLDELKRSTSTMSARSTTLWLISLAQSRAHRYLDVISAALDLDEFDHTLQSQTKPAASNINFSDYESRSSNCNICVSPWTLPNLTFDVVIGNPLSYDKESTDGTSISLRLEIRAVGVLFAKDLVGDSFVPALNMCPVSVVKCEYSKYVDNTHSTNDGFIEGSRRSCVGDVTLLVKLRNVQSRRGSDSFRKSDCSRSTPITVKEARLNHVNAMPPRPHSTIDLYTSSLYDEDDEVTVTLRFQTRRTLDGSAPKVCIDLVVN